MATTLTGGRAAPEDDDGARRPPGASARRPRHEVPTHLNVEDRLFFGLSLRQVMYLMIGLAGSYTLWTQWPELPTGLRLGAALAGFGVAAALAFVRWGGHGPEEWAIIGLRYATLPRRAVWRATPAPGTTSGAPPQNVGVATPPAVNPGVTRVATQAAFVGLEAIDDGMVRVGGGRYRAVLEIGGVDFGMRSDAEQESLVAAYASFLNGLTFPVQILIRVQPVDLEDYLQKLEQRARLARTEHVAVLAHDHATFLRGLASRRALLERRFYVVVPADAPLWGGAGGAGAPGMTPASWGDGDGVEGGARSPGKRLRRALAAPFAARRPWRHGAAGRGDGAGDDATAARRAATAAATARQQLSFRCAELARQLGRCGLSAQRLDTDALARLFYATWCPDLAGVQRLRHRVADYTTPVVRGSSRPAAVRHPSARADSPVGAPAAPATNAAGAGDTADAWRFALGTRSVADLVAPATVELARDHVRVDRHYLRTLAVTGYPRTVNPGWLAPLLYAPEPLEISVHVQPLATGEMVKTLSHKLVQLHSSRLLDARGGRLTDPEREVAYDDVERLRDALQRGEERVFTVSFYLLLRAPSLAYLDELTRRTEAVLDGMLAQSRVALLEQDNALRSCLPLGDDRLLVYRNLDTSSLATTFPFSSDALSTERGVFYGVSRRSHTPVIVDPFDPGLENANMAVIATSGAGKSYFTKLLALRNGLLGVDFLVIDPEDEYWRLCTAVEGQYVRLAGTSAQRLNPFDLPAPPPGAPPERFMGNPIESPDGARGQADRAGRAPEDEDDAQDVLAEQVTALVALLEIMVATPEAPLGAHERAVLDRAIYAAYAAAGITREPATHERPAPLLRDLYAVLQGVAAGGDAVASGLVARLHRYVEGSLSGLFAGPTNVALDRPFVVFNIQRLEPELRPLAIHVITAFVWAQVRRARRPRLLVVDEAWSVLQYREGGAFLAGLARRARKYYLGLVTISQSVTDFTASDAGRAVLANAAVKLLLKQDGATVDRLVALFGLTAEERQFLLAAGKGEGLLCARGSRVALQIEASAAEHRLATTAPAEVAALVARPARGPLEPRAGGVAPGDLAPTAEQLVATPAPASRP